MPTLKKLFPVLRLGENFFFLTRLHYFFLTIYETLSREFCSKIVGGETFSFNLFCTIQMHFLSVTLYTRLTVWQF